MQAYTFVSLALIACNGLTFDVRPNGTFNFRTYKKKIELSVELCIDNYRPGDVQYD